MPKIPRIIHQVWLGHDPIPRQLRLWSETIRFHHPDWQYRLWRDEDCSHLQPLMRKCSTLAGASDVVRLHALYACGGVYLDFDIECFKPLDPLLDVAAFGAYDGCFYEGGVYADCVGKPIMCNAVMASVPCHRWITDQLISLPSWVRELPPWGPKLATVFLHDDVHIYPDEYFYPFRPDSDIRTPHPDSFLAHHWQKMW